MTSRNICRCPACKLTWRAMHQNIWIEDAVQHRDVTKLLEILKDSVSPGDNPQDALLEAVAHGSVTISSGKAYWMNEAKDQKILKHNTALAELVFDLEYRVIEQSDLNPKLLEDFKRACNEILLVIK